ncbi:hypothetical protein HBB16_14040 [Pseudonocardia sp. MCCB 268]|nr:hypothetical protein [Pseudonocardia cytotoxica]
MTLIRPGSDTCRRTCRPYRPRGDQLASNEVATAGARRRWRRSPGLPRTGNRYPDLGVVELTARLADVRRPRLADRRRLRFADSCASSLQVSCVARVTRCCRVALVRGVPDRHLGSAGRRSRTVPLGEGFRHDSTRWYADYRAVRWFRAA